MRLGFAIVGVMLIGLLGCSSDPGLRADPVDVAGTVINTDGKPVGNVTINFFATSSSQSSSSFGLKTDGKFEQKLIPGKYTFAFEGKEAAMKLIPKKYHLNSSENTFEVPSSGTKDLQIKLSN